jgi:hypothetical protein
LKLLLPPDIYIPNPCAFFGIAIEVPRPEPCHVAMPIAVIVGQVGGAVLADIAQNHATYLRNLLVQLAGVLDAPSEINEVRRQVEILSIYVEKLLQAIVEDDSVVNATPSEEANAIEKFLSGCTSNLGILMEMIAKYTTAMADGGRTWSDSFKRMYRQFQWTQDKGSIEDLIGRIKRDAELVTQISNAIQRYASACAVPRSFAMLIRPQAKTSLCYRQFSLKLQRILGIYVKLSTSLNRGRKSFMSFSLDWDREGEIRCSECLDQKGQVITEMEAVAAAVDLVIQ